MSDKHEKKNHLNDELQELRGLEDEVVNRLKRDSDFEAKMIANFNDKVNSNISPAPSEQADAAQTDASPSAESGGSKGLEPTRYGDWEKKGRCSDF